LIAGEYILAAGVFDDLIPSGLSCIISFMTKNNRGIRIARAVFFTACAVLLAWFNMYINTGKRLTDRFQNYALKYGFSHSLPTFLGACSMQFPGDNWVAQEIIFEIKPDLILEIGTGDGGTTLFYATILEKVNEQGRVITVSRESPDEYRDKLESKLLKKGYTAPAKELRNKPKAYDSRIWHEKVVFIKGDSEDPGVVDTVAKAIRGRKVFMLLDAQESKEHVLKDLAHYALAVEAGSYIMVHDTVKAEVYAAVQQFVKENGNFQVDHSREKFLITLSPSGFLKKVSAQ